MIVGSKSIEYEELKLHCDTDNELIRYARELVPRILRHRIEILNNQRYLVSMHVRELNGIPYKKKMQLCESLLKGVSVTGYINIVVDWEDILLECNIEKIIKYLS